MNEDGQLIVAGQTLQRRVLEQQTGIVVEIVEDFLLKDKGENHDLE